MVRNAEFLVVVDVEKRQEKGLPLVRLASGIELDGLLELFPERVTERRGLEWNRAAERVEEASALLFDKLAIEERLYAPRDRAEAARLLADRAWDQGIARFSDAEDLEFHQTRQRALEDSAGQSNSSRELNPPRTLGRCPCRCRGT